METGDFVEKDIDGVHYSLLTMTLKLNSDMNCKLFKSCEKTKIPSSVASLNNAIGFIRMQGSEAYKKIDVYINMNQVTEGGITFEPDACNSSAKDLHGYKVDQSCGCNTCKESCDFKIDLTDDVMKGFSFKLVGFIYLFVTAATVFIFYLKYYIRKKYGDQRSRASSVSFVESEENTIRNSNDFSKNSNSNSSHNNINKI